MTAYEGVEPIPVPLPSQYDIRGCYERVRGIYRNQLHSYDLRPDEVISDILGGTKLMSIGMWLACAEGEYPIQYTVPAFDETGKPSPRDPVGVRLSDSAAGDQTGAP